MANRPRSIARDDRLSISQQEVTSRMRRVAQTLGRETPFRHPLTLASKLLLNGSWAWSIQQGPQTKRADSGRGQEHVVELADSPSGHRLHLGLTEEWRLMSSSLVFSESRLRFYLEAPGQAMIGPPAFRLEWKERDEESGAYVFPGKGAAHPHWQFGTKIDDYVTPLGLTADEDADEIARELLAGPVDETYRLEPGQAGVKASAAVASGRKRPLLQRFHFPAKAG